MNFRELLENKNNIVFDIIVNGNSMFSHTNADVIERKLKTAKFKKLNWSVLRTDKYGMEDITKLFK